MNLSRLAILSWVFVTHLAGIYLFTKGFLLTRLSLPNFTTCGEKNCGMDPTHKRAIVLIIDALRFDFITPDPPEPTSFYHHNVLTLPRELTAKRPKHSLIFNSYADPPTATLQRIKGITTGSLPTFVDIGNNFGGSSIAEDSLVKQIKMAGKKLAFMGDDTWMSVFPNSFEDNMTFPYDSFNVEDLHTVDEGVIRHLFPILEDPLKPFDFLIGHFLGVDHVGHRVGPDHPNMRTKLRQMNEVLKQVVDTMDEDTLLVVLGDHGMDRTGDHGGDGVFETSSALWIYSKGPPLYDASNSIPGGLLQYRTFPETTVRHRAVQQIDLVPTLSLLLGVPIPYNNLGTVIPELFWRDRQNHTLEKALEANTAQVMSYLETYRNSSSGNELNDVWEGLQSAYNILVGLDGESKWVAMMNFNRVALAACRSIWAQFNPVLMAFGLLALGMGLCATWSVYSGYSNQKRNRDGWLKGRLVASSYGGGMGILLGIITHSTLSSYVNLSHALLFSASLASSMTLIISSPPTFDLKSTPIILLLHSISFFSNSFTFWEERIVPFLLITSITPYVLTGFTAPNARLRYRILGFSLLFAACIRFISISTICREEQQPYCHVTFFASSSLPSPPLPVLYLIVPIAAGLPFVIKRFLHTTRSDSGLAKSYLPLILAPSLLGGSAFWLVEWIDSSSILGDEWTSLLRTSRTWIARSSFGWTLLAGGTLWWLVPLCLDIHVEVRNDQRQIQVIGFANAFGAPYLMFWTISFGIVYLCTQLSGQVVLALSTVALIAFLEVLDGTRDAKAFEAAFTSATTAADVLDPSARAANLAPPVRFADIVPIALLGLEAFYATGHQSTISSIQWKTAFLLTPTVTYPFSVLTVVLNSIGPVFLFALVVPLVAIWNKAPSAAGEKAKEEENGRSGPPSEKSDALARVKAESTLAALGIMIYYSALLLGASVSAAILRRHLMVWKVFAPRFMTAVLQLLAVDVGVLLGVGLGVERVVFRVSEMFRAML